MGSSLEESTDLKNHTVICTIRTTDIVVEKKQYLRRLKTLLEIATLGLSFKVVSKLPFSFSLKSMSDMSMFINFVCMIPEKRKEEISSLWIPLTLLLYSSMAKMKS